MKYKFVCPSCGDAIKPHRKDNYLSDSELVAYHVLAGCRNVERKFECWCGQRFVYWRPPRSTYRTSGIFGSDHLSQFTTNEQLRKHFVLGIMQTTL